MKTYEAMLLVDPTIATKEWAKIGEEIERIVKRNGGAVLSVIKWGERKLAFPVKRCNRGTYVVAYFAAPPTALGKVKADLQFSEVMLRSLILAHEGELAKEPPKDFETAGPLPPKTDRPGMGMGGIPGNVPHGLSAGMGMMR